MLTVIFPDRNSEYGLWFKEWLERGEKFSSKDYVRAQEARMLCNGELYKTMEGIDLLLCPSHLEQHTPTPKRMPMGQFLKTEIHGTQGLPCQWTFRDCQPSQCHAVLIRMASLYHVN